MIRRLVSLILLSTLCEFTSSQLSLIAVKLGDSVTLTCNVSRDDVGLSYWYKLNFGYMTETIASGSFDKISLQVGNVRSLTIRNVNKEDEATYFCQAGTAYVMEFINGTVLGVNDPKTQQKSVTVKQTPDVESVHLDDTVTLQCSLLSKNKNDTVQCPGEDKVHWFKGASESHPGIIYHGSIRNREKGRCDYSLLRTIMSSSDAGTYYCAVVTCGEILFGEGTQVAIIQTWNLAVIVLLVLFSYVVKFFLNKFTPARIFGPMKSQKSSPKLNQNKKSAVSENNTFVRLTAGCFLTHTAILMWSYNHCSCIKLLMLYFVP
uniref:Ig-like domain-containing protein n=1 Tax=Amphilophus citrinellus TaxID=61819 RepID=A0A3Q0R1N3_AMPCI